MANDTEQLVVQLEARIRDFEKNFEKASGTANAQWSKIEARGKQASGRIQTEMGNAASGIGNALKGIASSFGSAAGISGLGFAGMLATAVKINGELAKIEGLAKRAGLSTDRLQEVKFAANLKGVGDDTFATDMEHSLGLLSEAQRQVNDLKRLFNANGLSIKNNRGELLAFDQLLERAAQLMAGARSEQEKLKIAEMLGLSRDWIRVLDKGPEAFRQSAAEASNAGAVIDAATIKKAKEFDRAWHEATVRFKAGFTEAFVDLSRAFGEFWRDLVDTVPGAGFIKDTLTRWSGGLRGMTLPELENILARSIEQGVSEAEIARIRAELDRRLGRTPLKIIVTPKIEGGEQLDSKATVIPRDPGENAFRSATNEASKRIALVNSETSAIGQLSESRERARMVAELESAAIKANSEAGFQSKTVTDEQRVKINQLADAMEAAARRQRVAQQSFESFGEALKLSGNVVVDFFDKLGDKSTTFASLMTSAFAMLKKAALQAAILGEGPLAGLFGTKSSVSGGVGGIMGAIGSMFSVAKADGGLIRGPGTATSDSIHARLSDGEFVVRADATARYLPVLQAINAGQLPRFADGGLVSAQPIQSPALAGSSPVNIRLGDVHIAGGSAGTTAQNQDLADRMVAGMNDMAQSLVAKELRRATRPGGTLWRK